MNTLFLAWQDPVGRRWYTVGRLDRKNGNYVFTYTKGAQRAKEKGFVPLVSFPQVERRYESDEIFPLFANRVLSPNRPEFEEFTEWLSIPKHQADPIAILARTGGDSGTDTLEIFPCPEESGRGVFVVHFFIRGIRHQSDGAIRRVSELEPGEQLLLMADVQNPYDPHAYALRTAEKRRQDMHLLGYLPRYLASEFKRLPEEAIREARIEIERVNVSPAPIHFRVLCRLEMRWPEGFTPFSAEDYHSLVA